MDVLKKTVAAALALMSAAAAPALSRHSFTYTASAIEIAFNADDTYQLLGKQVRSDFVSHVPTVTFSFRNVSDYNEAIDKVLAAAFAETGRGNEGEYLRYTVRGYDSRITRSGSEYTVELSPRYRTTFQQEELVTQRVDEIRRELALDGMDDYNKLKTIYEYIINNVEYAYGSKDDLRYSAYGALFNGKAVCQGYSMLFYRLAMDSGISCRIITGTANGGGHAWNIAAINGVYYNLDATFDDFRSSTNECRYFLRGSTDFDPDGDIDPHILDTGKNDDVYDIDFLSDDFMARYPINPVSYDVNAPVMGYSLGDVNEDGRVDSTDASDVLTVYSTLSVGGLNPLTAAQKCAADINSDGFYDAKDASLVLSYYAYISTGGTLDMNTFIHSA